MIDWLTLGLPISGLTAGQLDKLLPYIGGFVVYNSEGDEVSKKPIFDIDKLRSDSQGIFWSIRQNGKDRFLTIAASPAQLEHGINVFGSDDIRHCAEVLIRHASRALEIFLPPPSAWHCTRLDFTHNYALPSKDHVKQALRELLKGNSSRQKATNLGGDSVYWGHKSDLIGGKAYDKGTQLLTLTRRNKQQATPEQIDLASRLLRFELSLKARWFRRYADELDDNRQERHWLDITAAQLNEIHTKFFGQFVGDSGVMEMDDKGKALIETLTFITGSKGRAKGAFATWMTIRQLGFDVAKTTIPERTWYLHKKYLLEAGLSEADLQTGTVIPFRRNTITLSAPVTSWEDLRRAA
jgi:II/X family phage/plasmid replication protein